MTDWVSAGAMLVVGLVVGAMFIFSMRRKQGREDVERADLEAKRDALVAQLRVETSADERSRLEREAADVLRKLDKVKKTGKEQPPAAEPATQVTAQRAALKGFAWGAISVAILAGIAWFVVQSAKPKAEQAAQPAPMTAPAADRELADLQRQVQQNPDNLALRDDLAKAYLERDNINGVAEQTAYVLHRTPNDARALTYQALVHIAARQPDAAAAMLKKATQSDPNLLDAWVGLAWLNASNGNMQAAEEAIGEAKKRHPGDAARLDQLLAHLRAPETSVPSAAPAASPAAPAPPPPTPATSGGEVVHLTLSAPNVSYPAAAVIFVIVREAGQTAGPPAAVKRVPLGSFPISFDLTSADSMMGQPLPPKLRIEARIDTDGDPMTHDPKDPAANADGVTLGSSVKLTLK